MDMNAIQTEYDAFGNVKTPQPHYESPKSNPGIVYNPANRPTNPGSLKVARQTVENLIWVTKDNAQINVGTQDTSPSTTEGEAGIIILDDQGGKVVSITQGHPVMGLFTSRPLTTTEQRDTPIPLVQIYDDSLQADAALSIEVDNGSDALYISVDGSGEGIHVTGDGTETNNMVTIENTNSANTNTPLQISTNNILNSHFCKVLLLNAVGHAKRIFTSDGTNPDTVLTGRLGDICLHASASGQMAYCDTDNSTSWTLI